MDKQSAKNYLSAGGMSDKQIKTVEGAFVCDAMKSLRQELEALYQDDNYDLGTLDVVIEIIDEYIKEHLQ